jgi:hypothetical protein
LVARSAGPPAFGWPRDSTSFAHATTNIAAEASANTPRVSTALGVGTQQVYPLSRSVADCSRQHNDHSQADAGGCRRSHFLGGAPAKIVHDGKTTTMRGDSSRTVRSSPISTAGTAAMRRANPDRWPPELIEVVTSLDGTTDEHAGKPRHRRSCSIRTSSHCTTCSTVDDGSMFRSINRDRLASLSRLLVSRWKIQPHRGEQ